MLQMFVTSLIKDMQITGLVDVERYSGLRNHQTWKAFFVWGNLKSVVYKTQPIDLNDLRQSIIDLCRSILRETFEKVKRKFENRLYCCMENNGAHFEELL